MKVAIVGAGGMLAQDLEKAFAQDEVVALTKEKVDITNIKELKETLSLIRPTFILNAAAYTDVDKAEQNREVAFEVNQQGASNLAEVALGLDAALVHYSTDYVFPGDCKDGYKEDDQPGPAVNIYGESKLAGEESVKASGCKYYILRTAWLYGQGGNNFVKTMLKLADNKKRLEVVADQYGCPTYTRDVAESTRQLLKDNYSNGVYHVVNEGVTTWYGFAKEIFRLSDINVKVVPVGSEEYQRPAARPGYSVLINTKGPKMRPWQEALRDYLKAPS